MIAALLLAAATQPPARNRALERCAEAVVAARHPRTGMIDTTGLSFVWRQVWTERNGWTIIGSIIAPEQGARLGRRFTCRGRERGRPRITFGQVARL